MNNRLGDYPAGAEFDLRAPYNQNRKKCERCNGTGLIFYDEDYDEVSEEIFEILSGDKFTEECKECDGNGEIFK